jgi:tRNA pseudouridine38-40 synthase
MRIALGVQYDGSAYCGWQIQPDQATVQNTLEKAIEQFIGNGSQVRVTAAGRTDTGVHALGQVVHFDADVERDDWSWVRGINTFLPDEVVVNWAKVVPSDFDARFSAHERTYVYAVFAGPTRTPILAKRVGYSMMPSGQWFDIAAMQSASRHLIGEHDFSSFRASECQSKTPIKHLYECTITSDQPFIFIKVRANAFLQHMVRNLVGSLLVIGQGKKEPEWIKTVLQAKDRELAAPTFAPDGLYLIKVGYPSALDIPNPHWQNAWLPKELMLSVFDH